MLSHIKIEGFKSIAELDVPRGNINTLIGANSAGVSFSIFYLFPV